MSPPPFNRRIEHQFRNFQMTRILESPPPDLSYPPDGSDRPILLTETSYLRTQLPDDTVDTPGEHRELNVGL